MLGIPARFSLFLSFSLARLLAPSLCRYDEKKYGQLITTFNESVYCNFVLAKAYDQRTIQNIQGSFGSMIAGAVNNAVKLDKSLSKSPPWILATLSVEAVARCEQLFSELFECQEICIQVTKTSVNEYVKGLLQMHP